MPRQVVILHGWSDTSKSFRPLASFLKEHGYEAVPVWLGDYISMDDDVRIEDVAARMETVVRQHQKDGTLNNTFDLIVHSTGGLVARAWLATYYVNSPAPVKRLVMLAPANYGSKLATMGKSLPGRVFKGWKNGFQTGQEMLTALSLASSFQYRLAQADIFAPQNNLAAPSPYGPDLVLPFVITGTHPYTSAFRSIINENGSDGTVRVAAASMNSYGATLDFTDDPANPTFHDWGKRNTNGIDQFALAVLPNRDHGSITEPDSEGVRYRNPEYADVGSLILAALGCDYADAYVALTQEWYRRNEDVARISGYTGDDLRQRFPQGKTKTEYFHQYFQVVTRVRDQQGAPVDDYFMEFYGPDGERGRSSAYFQRDVLESVYPKTQVFNRCLFIDGTDLLQNFYGRAIPKTKEQVLYASLWAEAPGKNISYFPKGKKGKFVAHRAETDGRWLKRNSTHFLDIIIPRTQRDRVFRLGQA